ncbi:hypothetical protein SAMN05443633_104337 [Chryseobacterium arachidis]|uniref:Uncharacterized protein n=1 Tax=Chryseobacterium arachidis TaxID=1416778 RepID=A0A1M5BYA4_9FLAO|nr:hypothetical protein [Chryseobacterium arachidis]SHF47513.1 hypothetical protein SAMN05443633_104337 [Chryseobacterium arachidis]
MNLAIYDFTPFANELPKFNLKLLLNIEDLNNAIFDEVFNILKPHQQEQYLIFKESEEAKSYREYRSTQLPYIDFNNLPEILDDGLLQKIIVYKKNNELRRVVYDLLSEEQKVQIKQYEIQNPELKITEEIKEAEETHERKRYPHKFNGNMGEPANADEFVLMFGVNPFTHEPETIKSFYEKYAINPNDGTISPKEKKE